MALLTDDVVTPSDQDEKIRAAADILRKGGVVAFPTETVYGLGADAMSEHAVARIFEAKGRPADNPLIVHLASVEDLRRVAQGWSEKVSALATRFWPGPLTLVLRRGCRVPSIVSAGLSTVAVRVPRHDVAQALLIEFAGPIAAPSANISGRPSPTKAEHVRADFGDRIEMILEGGVSEEGIESTVLDTTVEPFRILRPGSVVQEELAEVLGYTPPLYSGCGDEASPGTRHVHYKPRAKVIPFSGDAPAESGAFLTLSVSPPPAADFSEQASSIEGFAARLYAFFREADALGVEKIYVELPKESGLGIAIRDRIDRSAG